MGESLSLWILRPNGSYCSKILRLNGLVTVLVVDGCLVFVVFWKWSQNSLKVTYQYFLVLTCWGHMDLPAHVPLTLEDSPWGNRNLARLILVLPSILRVYVFVFLSTLYTLIQILSIINLAAKWLGISFLRIFKLLAYLCMCVSVWAYVHMCLVWERTVYAYVLAWRPAESARCPPFLTFVCLRQVSPWTLGSCYLG